MLTPGLGRSVAGALGRMVVTRAPGNWGWAVSSASCRLLRRTAVTVAMARWLLMAILVIRRSLEVHRWLGHATDRVDDRHRLGPRVEDRSQILRLRGDVRRRTGCKEAREVGGQRA